MTEWDDERIWSGLHRRLARLEAPVVSLAELERRRARAAGSWIAGVEMVGVVALLGVGLFLWGQPTNRPLAGAQVVALPHTPVSGPQIVCNSQLLVGTLAGDLGDARHAWLMSAEGARVDVAWPAGFDARFAPEVEILDPQGNVVARAGEEIRLGGSFDDAGRVFNVCGVPG